jgi:hypothetical protein
MISRLFAILAMCGAAAAQPLSFGVLGGASVTEDFHNQTIPIGDETAYSSSKRYIFGAEFEVRLPAHWSIEVDGLYHPLGYTYLFQPVGAHSATQPVSVTTWELPVLAKYRFRLGSLAPFVEAGAAVRTTGNLNSSNPSHFGFTAGAGIETSAGWLRISPQVRYYHWAPDLPAASIHTVADQVELLAGFSTGAPVGHDTHFRVGAIAGLTLTPDYPSEQSTDTAIGAPGTVTFSTSSGPRSFIAGPEFEALLAGGFSVELDAIWRPIRSSGSIVSSLGNSTSSGTSRTTWELPVLGKYRVGRPRTFQPFLEAGPSFRVEDLLNGTSRYGVTAGAGVETHYRRVAIAPALRYTHWGHNAPLPPLGPFENQLELIGGFSF